MEHPGSSVFVITLTSTQKKPLCLYVKTFLPSLSPSLLPAELGVIAVPRGPIPGGLTKRPWDMHSGRVIIYPYVITLKSRCRNILRAGWRKPPEGCLERSLRKWRGEEQRRSKMKRWGGDGREGMVTGGGKANVRSSFFVLFLKEVVSLAATCDD